MRRTSVAIVTGIAMAVLLAAGACSSGDDSQTSKTSNPKPSVTTAPTTTSPTTTIPTKVVLESEKPIDFLFRQGVARIGDGWILSGQLWLQRVDDQLQKQAELDDAIPPAWKAKGFNHIGDVDVDGKILYAPFEQPHYEKGEQAMARYDARTLAFIDAVTVKQHEASFVTVDRTPSGSLIAYSLNHFGGDALLRYRVTDDNRWIPLRPLKMSRRVEKVQGADIAQGAAWLSTDDQRKGVYRVDLRSGDVTFLGSMGHLDTESEGEGIDVTVAAGGNPEFPTLGTCPDCTRFEPAITTIMIPAPDRPPLFQRFGTTGAG